MVLTTLQTKAGRVRECHGSGIAFNQVLYTWSPVFKKVQGQESKVPVTKTRDRLLCWQWEAASAAFSRTGFDLGIKAPYSSSTGYLNLDWNQVYRIRVQGPQSLEYCQVVLEVDLAFSRENEWILHQFGLGALPGPSGSGLSWFPYRKEGWVYRNWAFLGKVGGEILFSQVKSVNINWASSS